MEPYIEQVDPNTFEYQEYSNQDKTLIESVVYDTSFTGSTDYIELYIYDENKNVVSPESTFELQSFNIKEGDVLLNPSKDVLDEGFDIGKYFTSYNFFRKHILSSPQEKYYIDEISPSRTEIRLKSNKLSNTQITDSVNDFIAYRESKPYFVDFYLNFGNNQQVIANNINVITDEDPTSIIIKLYEPLPSNFNLKDQCWVVEEISTPQAYSVFIPPTEILDLDNDSIQIKGPNLSLNVVGETGVSSQKLNYNQLLNTSNTSSLQQLQSLLEEKGIKVNVDYEDRNEFIKFSSAEERLKNFYYKASLIESTQNQLSSSIYNINGNTTGSISYSSSKASLESIIDTTIENFDGYEYFLYFNSSSKDSWPKSTSTYPYKLYSTGSIEALSWYGSNNEYNLYFGGQTYTASQYDQDNPDWLYRTIPEYLVEDPNNAQYELFLDMVGQHFDNIWVYTKDVTNRFNADNRLDYGISKDLVADAIKEFGVKLYSNNYNKDDLFQSFLGINEDGSSFPITNITSSLPIPANSGLEYVTTPISASDSLIPQNDVLKSIYKRIYHNLPYLIKSKGTIQGLKTLVNSFGIPDTILNVQEYGSGRKNPDIHRQYQQYNNVFNYYLDFEGTQTVQSDWVLNSSWSSSLDRPETLMFRFKPETVSTPSVGPTSPSQSLFSLDTGVLLTLDYNKSPDISGSYSGSIVDPEYQFGDLVLYPEGSGLNQPSTSISLPFYNGDWWSVMVNYVSGSGYILSAKNKSCNEVFEQGILYSDINSISLTGSTTWGTGNTIDFGTPSAISTEYSGGLQEIRYYTNKISDKVFSDYTVNPLSFEGNSVNQSPETLAFRASLGGVLYTESISIHPKISGSWDTIDSFSTNSDFTITNPNFKSNRDKIVKNEIPSGIRSAINDSIYIAPTDGISNLILLEQLRYLQQEDGGRLLIGDPLPTKQTVLSPFRSVQQKDYSNQTDNNVKYLEVALSPQNQINNDIINQIGYFNIGEYIGDVRNIYDNTTHYPDLDKLRNDYFQKYIKSYDLVDFIRLIKFFDNSLFKMIKDFTPSNVTLSAGVVIKQHLLERNRHKAVKVSTNDYSTLSGSIPVVEVEGGTGGILDRYQSTPIRFNLTQSWSEIIQTLQGPTTKTHTDEAEFYNGEFTTPITVDVSGEDCSEFTNPKYSEVEYRPIFVSPTSLNETGVQYTEEEFVNTDIIPERGTILLWHDNRQVKHIKVSNTSLNGINISDVIVREVKFSIFLNSPSTKTPTQGRDNNNTLPTGLYVWPILYNISYPKYTYIKNDVEESPFIVYSEDVDNVNYNLRAYGDFVYDAAAPDSLSVVNPTLKSGISASIPQGYFPASTEYPTESFFRGWNNAKYLLDYQMYETSSASVYNPSLLFNQGETEISTANNSVFRETYQPSTEPWFTDAPSTFIRQKTITDPTAVVRPPTQIVAILLTPLTDCKSLNINTSGVFIGVDFGKHGSKFTEQSTKQVLKKGVNGSTILEDIELFNPNGTTIIWSPESITTGTATTNLPEGSYGVFKTSTEGKDDRIVLDIKQRSGISYIHQINYCSS